MTPAHPDIAGLMREAQANRCPIPESEARRRLGAAYCACDLATETLIITGDEITLPPITWLRLLRRAHDRHQRHATPPPNLLATLTEPTLSELIHLHQVLRRRRFVTTLEQVAREVGGRAYAEVQAAMWDRPVVIQRGRIVGLPSGTYAILLRDIIRQRQADETTVLLAHAGG